AEQLPDEENLLGKSAAILVMSDRASNGEYEDKSGPVLKDLLCTAGADIKCLQVIPDDPDRIAAAIKGISTQYKPDILIASGGTGPGPRDVTPDVLEKVCDR